MENQQPNFIAALLNPAWKRWLLAAVIAVAVFIGIKEASKQAEVSDTIKISDKYGDDKIVAINDDSPLKLPSFPAGEKAFALYLQKNIHVDADTKGSAIASFVVDKSGSLTNVKILRSVNPKADQEVVRVLEASPKWNPGKQNGKVVNVAFSLPVNFDKR